MAYNEYPTEVHAAAYRLHAQGKSYADICRELDKYCQKNHKRTGPSVRAIATWAKKDDWAAQDELAKADLINEARESSVQEQLDILAKLKKLEDEALDDFYSQNKEKLRMSRGQALYGALEITRLRNQLLKQSSKGIDVRKILESAMEKFVKILRQVLGTAFTDKESEIFDLLEKEVLKENGSERP